VYEKLHIPWILACLLFASLCPAADSPRAATLEIDATEAARQLFHSHLTLPVQPGPLVLHFPKWLPGTHTPSGAVNSVVNLRLSAGGKDIAWRRDDVEMFTFRTEIPAGADTLEVRLDFISPVIENTGFTDRFTTAGTANIALVNWESMLFYPKGAKPEDLIYTARIKLPLGWDFATALPIEKKSMEAIEFKPAPLVTLVDSPLIAGKYFRKFDLGQSQGVPHEIDAVAESAEALEMPPETLTAYKSLILEAHALFGSHHYRDYHFLLTLSDPLKTGGWEHHECSDNRAAEQMLTDETDRAGWASLLPHEYTHSWNGKYRRPAGLATPDYQEPMRGELLWVYEGMTQYWGNVLAARCGLLTLDQSLAQWASMAAHLDNTPGRKWRPLEATAVAAQLTYESSHEWESTRRSTDFYNEGALIWLEADTIIRHQTNDQKSLDDFCKIFFGGGSGLPEVKPYTFDELCTALDSITHYDWKQFFRDRIYTTTLRAPLAGLQNGGWKLIYKPEPNEMQKAAESKGKYIDLMFSLGLDIGEEGRIGDVLAGSPADKTGLAPGLKIVAVNTRKYSDDLLRDAVKRSSKSQQPIELIAENQQFMKVYEIDYHGGPRYPHLERDNSKPDLLSEILKAHVKHPATAP
jgi:predicted metalloprotease with PDZ domain